MYFITSGTVAAVTETGREIVHLEDGDHFGEIALIQKDTRVSYWFVYYYYNVLMFMKQ